LNVSASFPAALTDAESVPRSAVSLVFDAEEEVPSAVAEPPELVDDDAEPDPELDAMLGDPGDPEAWVVNVV